MNASYELNDLNDPNHDRLTALTHLRIYSSTHLRLNAFTHCRIYAWTQMGWKHKTSLKEGLNLTYKDFLKNYDHP